MEKQQRQKLKRYRKYYKLTRAEKIIQTLVEMFHY